MHQRESFAMCITLKFTRSSSCLQAYVSVVLFHTVMYCLT